MAALDFPPSSESPFIAPNGVVYFWNDDGFWEADTSEVPTSDNTFLKLDASNDPVTGSLNITGDLDITGKMTSASTGAGDGGTTVVTKDFIDGNGGTGSIGYWDRSGTSLSPVNGGDSVLIGGALPSTPNITLNANGQAKFLGPVYAKRTLGTAGCFVTQLEGSADNTAQIYADGSAEFAGRITSVGLTSNGGSILADRPNASDVTFLNRANGTSTARIQADGTMMIGGVLSGVGVPEPNLQLNPDGSCSFASGVTKISTSGRIDVGAYDSGSNAGQGLIASISESVGFGTWGAQAKSTIASPEDRSLFLGRLGTTAVFDVKATGSATFDGNILTGGISFNGNTVDANTLGDYEEGDATIATFTGNSTGSNNVSGSYVKIGTKVFCTGSAVVSPNTDSSITEVFFSLPFSKKSGTGVNGNITVVSVRTGARPIFGEQTLGVSNAYGVDDALKDAITIGSYDYGVAVQISYSYIAAT